MNNAQKAVKVSENVYWVGAIDWEIRDFHGYSTKQGTTYNAYLIIDEKVTLIDTVKAPFKDELLSRVASVIEPERIDYVVSNHSEMDHSGSLGEVIARVKPEKAFASVMGVKALSEHFGLDLDAVKEGESINLGNMSLTFLHTPLLHWPDSMFSYLKGDNILFSSDAFGMHLATSKLFDDEVDNWQHEAAKYYGNILLPYSSRVIKLLDKFGSLGLDVDIIAPDHGLIWRKDITTIMELYRRWALQKARGKAVIVYDTMWQSTAKMARAISEGLSLGGIDLKVLSLKSNDRSDIMTEVLEAGAIAVGSPTLNNNMFPTIADFLTYFKGLKPKNLKGMAFGSYGWSGEASGFVNDILEETDVELVSEPIKTKFVPDQDDLVKCVEAGINLAKGLRE